MQRIVGKMVGGGIRIVPINEIAAIQSELHVQRIFMHDGRRVEIRKTLASLKEELDELAPGQFVTASKGVVVNVLELQAVYSDHIEVTNGYTFPLAKRYYRQFKEEVLSYLHIDPSKL